LFNTWFGNNAVLVKVVVGGVIELVLVVVVVDVDVGATIDELQTTSNNSLADTRLFDDK